MKESTMPLLDKLQWRYATKKMDPSRPVPADKVERIIEAARLAPTSSGLQPYEILLVTNPDVRKRIAEVAWNQQQVVDGSHLLVFAAWDDYTAERINHMFDLTNDVRGFRNEGWENYRQMLLSTYPQRGAEVNFSHTARQAFLGLRARGLKSVAMLPLGYRAEEGDWLKGLPKVRRPRDQFVTEVA
jgi:nitroreductase